MLPSRRINAASMRCVRRFSYHGLMILRTAGLAVGLMAMDTSQWPFVVASLDSCWISLSWILVTFLLEVLLLFLDRAVDPAVPCGRVTSSLQAVPFHETVTDTLGGHEIAGGEANPARADAAGDSRLARTSADPQDTEGVSV
jgi:hypothetical protein